MTNYIKYPTTKHMPWSEGVSRDDKIHNEMNMFHNKEVIVTEKMDGENTTLYSDYYHARSIDGRSHPSRDAVKNIWGQVKHLIPENWRICGENLFAKHSIEYDDLESYFLVFSVWDENNNKLHYDDMITFVNSIGLTPVPLLWRGVYNEEQIKSLWSNELSEKMEGYVVQNSESFNFNEFNENTAKFVRKNHVQTNDHWMHSEIKKNKLK